MIFTAIVHRPGRNCFSIDVIADSMADALAEIDDAIGAEVIMIAPKGDMAIEV